MSAKDTTSLPVVVTKDVVQPEMTKAVPDSSGEKTKNKEFQKCLNCEVLIWAGEKYCWGCTEEAD